MKSFFSAISIICIAMLSSCASDEPVINDEDKTAEQKPVNFMVNSFSFSLIPRQQNKWYLPIFYLECFPWY